MRRQYQIRAEPVLGTGQFAERVTEDRWQQPLSTPDRNNAGKAARVLIAALAGYCGCIAPTQEKAFANGAHADWIQPLSEPIVKAKKLPTSEQQTLAFVDWTKANDQRWFSPLSDPVRRIPFRLERFTWAPTEIVDVGKWFSHLREPYAKKLFLRAENQQFIAFVDWQPIADSASQRWLSELSVPVRRPVRVAGEFYYSPYTIPLEDVTLDKWYKSLSEPRQRSKWLEASYHPYQAYTGSDPFPESVTADRWQIGLTDPVRLKVALQTYPIYSPYVVTAETITADKWYAELNQPVRRIPTRLGEFTYNPAEISQVSKWFQEFSQPVRLRLLPPTEQQALSFEVEPPAFEQFGWFSHLSEWPRQRPKVTFQQYLAYTGADPFYETVSLDRWQTGLSEPQKPLYSGLGSSQQQTYTAPVYVSPIQVSVVASIEEPGPTFVQVLQYQGLAWYPFPQPTAEEVFADSWDARLSEPKRIPRAQQYQFTAFAPTEIILEPEWFEPLIQQPTISRLSVAEYPYLAFVKAAPFGENVSSDRWLQGLSLPVRIRSRYQQTNAVWPLPPTVTTFTYFSMGSLDPIIRARGFQSRYQQTLAFVKAVPFGETVWTGSICQPFSLPVRRVRFTPKQDLAAPARWEFVTGPTTVVQLLTSVVFTVVLPHRSEDGGSYGEFGYGEQTLDRPASFFKIVIKRFSTQINVRIGNFLADAIKKQFKSFSDRFVLSGSGKVTPASGGALAEADSGNAKVTPASGDALTTPRAGRGNIRIKPDP